MSSPGASPSAKNVVNAKLLTWSNYWFVFLILQLNHPNYFQVGSFAFTTFFS